ncbi:DUF1015 family protein [Candidatus Protochlamydia sp. W-9]|uniref:DUF1015 family protein n=1 Tax=Candidatus Protochlamydia sp. W-9 TaxID=1785087 RepID=UPI00096A8170|nr:DUF1015 family protein [Candidatus Protochlamydia sp. W-9]
MINTLPFKGFIKNAWKESPASFYLYQVKKKLNLSTGLVCSIPFENIISGNIVPHEQIYQDRIPALYENLVKERKQKNPILLITDDSFFEKKIADLLLQTEIVEEREIAPEITHRLLKSHISNLNFRFSSPLCVADGHHRLSALLNYYHNHHKIDAKQSGIMATIFYGPGVNTRNKGILLNHLPIEPHLFLERICHLFEMKLTATPSAPPTKNHNFQMLFNNQWFNLSLRPQFIQKNDQKRLGIEIFREFFLKKILNFSSYTNNPLLKMIFEECNISSLKDLVRSVEQVGFVISSDPCEIILEKAREGKILEPNSTYFEPKFLNSMIEYSL